MSRRMPVKATEAGRPLTKGTGSDQPLLATGTRGVREVPVPFFNGLLRLPPGPRKLA